MPYSHIKKQAIPLLMLLAGMVPFLSPYLTAPGPQPFSVAYASHGLRVYVDPDTGQFGPPPEPTTDISTKSFSAQALSDGPVTLTVTEHALPKTGGGYSVNLQERFRPSRKGS